MQRITGKNIYLKCESLQPSGAFKDRGIGNLCLYYANQGAKGFVSSSGGNAGMAVAYAAQILKLPAVVVVPTTTPPMLIDKIRAEKAQVIVEGINWNAADEIAQKIVQEKGYAFIPPFDHRVIWDGYMSIIDEIDQDLGKPDAIIVSVGGGGLYSGLVEGLRAHGWRDVTIITAETEGAASMAASIKAKKRVILEHIDTIATTLGAKQICQQAFDFSQTHPTIAQTVTDFEAVQACLHFADDHRMLVEPSCGAALAIAYENRALLHQFNNIVVIVCGGNGVSLELLRMWGQSLNGA